MAARSSEVASRTRCRTLLGGFGVPGLRDLDFGRNFVSYVEHLDWPEGVMVEEIPSSALLVLHRLQELRPTKVIVVAAAQRWPDPPGTVRRYQLGTPPGGTVHEPVAAAPTDGLGLSHTLALARQWGALPETVVIEVEPAETTVGLGFSEEVDASLDQILALVRQELAGEGSGEGDVVVGRLHSLEVGYEAVGDSAPRVRSEEDGGRLYQDPDTAWGPSSRPRRPLTGRPSTVRFEQLPPVEDLELTARIHPGDPGWRKAEDWFEVVPLPDGWTAFLLGEVQGEGVETAALVAQLRTAAKAYTLIEGPRPGQVLTRLDELLTHGDGGKESTFLCVAVHPRTNQLRIANAGHSPPLLCAAHGPATPCEGGFSPPLGVPSRLGRPEATVPFSPDTTVMLLTYGLVAGTQQSITERMSQLCRAASDRPRDPGVLCDHVLAAARTALPPGEGGCLLAIGRS